MRVQDSKTWFSLAAKTGPRNGHMREYFEIGEDVTSPRVIPAFHDPSLRQMIVPPPETKPVPPQRCRSGAPRRI